MKIQNFILLALVSLFLFSCSSLSKVEPAGDGDTLMVGTIDLTASNFKVYGSSTVNGRHSNDIILTFYDNTAQEKIEVETTGSKGLFYMQVNPDHNYELRSLYYKKQIGTRSWASLRTNVNNFRFTFLPGMVNNLGRLDWTADGRSRIHKVTQKNGSDEVNSIFVKSYSESLWNSYEWQFSAVH